MNAVLVVLLVVAAIWTTWYYETHGSINLSQLFGF